MKTSVKIVLSVVIVISLFFLFRNCLIKKDFPNQPLQPETKTIKSRDAKIALVLDDWGYNLNNLKILNKIRSPLTIGVLPHLPFSQKISKFSKSKGYQVILHLPLESYEHKNMEDKTICCHMKEEQIIDIIREALESVPQAAGISNHMGSKATEDRHTMGVVFKEIKKKNLFFSR